MEVLITAACVVGGLAGIIALLVYVNNRDQKKESMMNNKESEAKYPRL